MKAKEVYECSVRFILTLRLGSLTKAMKATQSPMPRKSMSAQWPVRTQMQTTTMETVRLTSSARLKRPHRPSDILPLPGMGGHFSRSDSLHYLKFISKPHCC
jgi:hypothetical protein